MEMERILASTLDRQFTGTTESALIEEIKSTAADIIELRRNNATTVSDYICNVENWRSPLTAVVKNIKSQLAVYYEDHPLYDSIVSLCDDVIDKMQSFETELQIIKERFKNEKIKITTIGAARAGKSLFTQLFTGLGEDVVKTQEGSEDCTGALSNLYHDATIEEGKFFAKVFFHTELEILDSINTLLNEVWNSQPSWKPSCSNLPRCFNSITEISRFVGKAEMIESDIVTSGVDNSVINGLLAYFRNNTYFEFLNHDEIIINNDPIRLTEFNYMKAATPRYLAVKEIQLYVNMGLDNLCADFIIADTQGASIIAGPKANDDIFRAIDDSDAVFSICANRGSLEGLDFYNKVLKSYIKGSVNDILRSSLRERHFTLVNLWNGQPIQNLNQSAKQLEYTGTTCCAYLGTLKDEECPENPKGFVRKIIIDMLGRISKQVLRFDQNRIQNSNMLREQLAEAIHELSGLLNKISSDLQLKFNKEEYALKRIQGLFHEVVSELDDMYQKDVRNSGSINDDSEEDFCQELNDKDKDIQTFRTIAGCFPKTELIDVIEEGVKQLYNIVESSEAMKLAPIPDDFGISPYIGKLVAKFREDFGRNRNNIFEQKELDITVNKDKVFTMIWDVLRIPVVFRTEHNVFLQEITSLYKAKYYENIMIPPKTFYCHQVLKEYFQNVEIEDYEKINVLLDKEELLAALTNVIREMDIKEIVTEHYVSCSVAMLRMYRDLRIYFTEKCPDSVDVLEFYVSHLDLLTVDDPEYKLLLERHEADKVLRLFIDKVSIGYKQTIKPLILVANMNINDV